MLGLHPDLKRHNALVFVSSLAAGVLGALMIFAGVVALEMVREVPSWILILFGVAFLVIAYLGTVLSPRWYRSATRAVAAGRPIEATVTLRREYDGESVSLVARVRPGAAAEAARGEIPLLVPRWDVEPLLDGPVSVGLHVDTMRSRVMAIETDRGLLWSIPYHRPRG